MDKIFELISPSDKEEEKKTEVGIGIRVKLSSCETICPVTRSCKSYQALETEVCGIRQNLEDVLKDARQVFDGFSKTDKLGLRADMKPGEIWTLLSSVPDERDFVQAFNALEQGKRKEVAEHVLTHCNVFSGRAAVFSSRYDDQSALME